MSTENETPVESTQDEDLDAFASTFFGQKELPFEETNSEDEEDSTEDTDATLEETQDEEDTEEPDDTLAPEEDDSKAKPKKNRLQERIDQLVKEREDEKRERVAIQARLDELTRAKQDTAAPKAKDTETPRPVDAPAPSDLKEDGTEKYPLGEFDPNYIVDLTKYTLKQEQSILEERTKQEELQKAQDAQRAELASNWNVQLSTAQERYPDFQDKGQNLVSTFEGIDEAYGEYLTTTLMAMDHGADVLYYLANNVEEAQKIVDSGPTRATIALGRLEAAFTESGGDSNEQTPRPVTTKTSKAPPPPPINKGSSGAVASVSVDTDDLDAFANLLFSKKKLR